MPGVRSRGNEVVSFQESSPRGGTQRAWGSPSGRCDGVCDSVCEMLSTREFTRDPVLRVWSGTGRVSALRLARTAVPEPRKELGVRREARDGHSLGTLLF